MSRNAYLRVLKAKKLWLFHHFRNNMYFSNFWLFQPDDICIPTSSAFFSNCSALLKSRFLRKKVSWLLTQLSRLALCNSMRQTHCSVVQLGFELFALPYLVAVVDCLRRPPLQIVMTWTTPFSTPILPAIVAYLRPKSWNLTSTSPRRTTAWKWTLVLWLRLTDRQNRQKRTPARDTVAKT